MQHVTVIGAGTMGHGIAQVAAMAGCTVRWFDPAPAAITAATEKIRANLKKTVELGQLDAVDPVLERLVPASSFAEAVCDAEIIVEAVPEKLDIKRSLFQDAEAHAPADCIFATNTSSLSIAAIAEPLGRPGRVIGTHFFNPVHRMALLEIIVAASTDDAVLDAVRAWGVRLGKEVIVVRDFPGFATSRLGVCLGMEAIRMVEQGVASPEDIDKAMVLGYRHPVGPLRLTDMVGLDVRMAIGEYLARELNNPAFNPPRLMREMVARGDLGQKSGRGFYPWR